VTLASEVYPQGPEVFEQPAYASIRMAQIPELQFDACRNLEEISGPLVIRRHAKIIRARSAFDLNRLGKQLGDREIVVEHKHRWNSAGTKISAREYLAGIDDTEFYWRQASLSLLQVNTDLPVPPTQREDTRLFDNFWIGPKGTVQTFHQDNHSEGITNHNFYFQISGAKYIAVASPDDSCYFRSRPLRPNTVRHSAASPFDISIWSQVASLAHSVLRAGDMVYIPPRYWHFVQSLSTSVSVSRWWFDSRIAEILYSVASDCADDREQSALVGDRTAWEKDLAHFGGRAALDSVLSRLQPLQRYAIVIRLMKFYGEGVIYGTGQHTVDLRT
jgi:hypothetical protein